MNAVSAFDRLRLALRPYKSLDGVRKFVSWMRFVFPKEIKRLYMICVLYVAPLRVHRLVNTGAYPTPDARMPWTDDMLDDFEFFTDTSSPLDRDTEAHVILRGTSFDKQTISGLKGKVYLCNWLLEERVDLPNIVYVTGDQNELRKYILNDMVPVLFSCPANIGSRTPAWVDGIEEMADDPRIRKVFFEWRCGAILSGSGIHSIIGALRVSKKLHVHGWDNYMPRPINRMPSLVALFTLMYFGGSRSQPNGVVECALPQWMYAARMMTRDDCHVNGQLSGVRQHPSLLRRINDVYYRNAPAP